MAAAGQASAEHEEQLFHVPSVISIQVLNSHCWNDWGPSRPMARSTFHVWLQAGPQKQPSACASGHSSQMELIRDKSTSLTSQSEKLLSRQGMIFHPFFLAFKSTKLARDVIAIRITWVKLLAIGC